MRPPNALQSALIRTAASLSSRRGRNASLLVLIFHRVVPEPDPLLPGEPDASRFAGLLDLLGSCFNVLPLTEAVRHLRERTLPPCAVSITFDDGYANNREIAQPILAAKGLPATVFVAPGFLDGGLMFNDSVIEAVRRAPQVLDLRSEGLGEIRLTDPTARIKAIEALLQRFKYLEPGERARRIDDVVSIAGVTLPTNLMMTSEQVRELHRAGIEVGAHTVDHPILTSIDDRLASDQIVASRRRLEELIGTPVRSFAYPNGGPGRDYDGRHVAMARDAGFDFALSTAWGSATGDSDLFQIPRVAPWDRSAIRYGLRLARAYAQRRYRTAQV